MSQVREDSFQGSKQSAESIRENYEIITVATNPVSDSHNCAYIKVEPILNTDKSDY